MPVSVKKARAKREGVERAAATPSYRRVETIAIDLFSMELGLQSGVDTAIEDRASPFATCSIDYFLKKSNKEDQILDVAFLTCKAGRRESREATEKLTASYLCFFNREFDFKDDVDLREYYEYILILSAWPKFRDMMGIINVQGGLRLLDPPMKPNEIKWGNVIERKSEAKQDSSKASI